jgi:GTP-binding protein
VAKLKLEDESKDITPLLDLILRHVPAVTASTSVPFRMQPFNLAYDNFLGRMAVGRVYEGTIKAPGKVVVKTAAGEVRQGNLTKLFTFEGLRRKEVSEAVAGDIVLIAGLPDIYIGETICASAEQEALPAIQIDEPTISLDFLVNNSPFAGREGKYVTNRQLKERLEKELEINVGLKIDLSTNDRYKVFGRGELHIAILLENMRREGYELQVSQPQVIIKDIDGVKSEPFEEVIIDVADTYSGTVIEKLSRRRGLMTDMRPSGGHTRIVFNIPTRGLLGYRSQFIMDTRGEGIMTSRVIGFRPYVGEIEKKDTGS